MKKKVLFAIGTRPEAIKVAPVVQRCRRSAALECSVLCTGQHHELADQAFAMFDLVPDRNLRVMKRDQNLSLLTSRMMAGITEYARHYRPDMVVVQGDTTTALAAAQVAFFNHIPLAHIEAGLRTGDRRAPFPEEINRVFISKMADLHFAPTSIARDNLVREGVEPADIHVTGNTVVDALNMMLPRALSQPPRIADLPPEVMREGSSIVLVTGHRRESIGEGLVHICQAIKALALAHPSVAFVYPVHLNPRIHDTVYQELDEIPNIHLIQPLDYRGLLFMISRSRLVITDSGGIQEEAPSFGRKVLVTRHCTERPEGVAAGMAVLVGHETGRIVEEATRCLRNGAGPGGCSTPNPYGDGNASERIVGLLESYPCPVAPMEGR
ncbi:MAG TPA: UDP-N-acetylglucosamine 2-epimerase (non-hydrolyzing) [Syntrophus sp. (in: bacteria)]|jgi:UDP-N-acetylglucosamine 2-epimerase (non-hydrolysing)|nr:UDP-N-acetylglucosamine 2-epimerase (non-hydrolyzing) [Syntrophus sp. (in: bacteria)]